MSIIDIVSHRHYLQLLIGIPEAFKRKIYTNSSSLLPLMENRCIYSLLITSGKFVRLLYKCQLGACVTNAVTLANFPLHMVALTPLAHMWIILLDRHYWNSYLLCS